MAVRRKKPTFRTYSTAENALWRVAQSQGVSENALSIERCASCNGYHIFQYRPDGHYMCY